MKNFYRSPYAAAATVALLIAFAGAPAAAQDAGTTGKAETVELTLLQAGSPAAGTPPPRTSGRAHQPLPETHFTDYTFVFPELTGDPTTLVVPTNAPVDAH